MKNLLFLFLFTILFDSFAQVENTEGKKIPEDDLVVYHPLDKDRQKKDTLAHFSAEGTLKHEVIDGVPCVKIEQTNSNEKNKATGYFNISGTGFPVQDNPWSISIWVYPLEMRNSKRYPILGYGSDSGTMKKLSILYHGGYLFDYSSEVSFGASKENKQWTHIAATYNGSFLTLFVNGVQMNRFEVNLKLKKDLFMLGSDGRSNWNGYLACLRFYKRLLSPDEIGVIYEKELPDRKNIPQNKPERQRTDSGEAVDFTAEVFDEKNLFSERNKDNINQWEILKRGISFRFQDSAKTNAVCFGRNRRRPMYQGISILNTPVSEIQAEFEDTGTLKSLEFILYSRGDVDGIHDKKIFDRNWKELQTAVEEKTGNPGKKYRETLAKDRKQELLVWEQDDKTMTLCAGTSLDKDKNFRGEYIRLIITRPKTSTDGATTKKRLQNKVSESKRDLPQNVVSEKDGRIYISNIPMINQGAKGYAVAATIERVIRYYGGSISQHEIAQLANTKDGGGPGIRETARILEELARRFRCKVENVKFDAPDRKKILELYNKELRKLNRTKFKEVKTDINYETFYETLEEMDKNTLYPIIRKSKPFKDFMKVIPQKIKNGVPIFWAVPRRFRLLIGYNPETEEIIYSDSWGAAHESKTMPDAEAYFLTNTMTVLVPSS